MPIVIDTLAFDKAQITSKLNYSHPKFGDPCHPLTSVAGQTIVIIRPIQLSQTCGDHRRVIVVSAGFLPRNGSKARGVGYEIEKSPNLFATPSSCLVGVLMTYQSVTGSLCPGGHPGSYNGQDAYNDMLVIDGSIMADSTSTTLNTQEKERPIVEKSIVRRLTPRECERLQGFPDDWTLIGEPEEVEVKDTYEVYNDNGEYVGKADAGTTHKEIEYFYTDLNGKRKRCADSARYRAVGNSIAVGYANGGGGFWMWLMERISAQYDRPATMGSLFDGIGGFPLAWEHYNGKGSAVWASEIEPFCIEVTRRRFPEGDELL